MPERIIVDVKAGSREEGIEKLGDNWYLVKVKAPREKGRANAAVLKLLRKHFKNARLVSGFTDKKKIIEIG